MRELPTWSVPSAYLVTQRFDDNAFKAVLDVSHLRCSSVPGTKKRHIGKSIAVVTSNELCRAASTRRAILFPFYLDTVL